MRFLWQTICRNQQEKPLLSSRPGSGRVSACMNRAKQKRKRIKDKKEKSFTKKNI